MFFPRIGLQRGPRTFQGHSAVGTHMAPPHEKLTRRMEPPPPADQHNVHPLIRHRHTARLGEIRDRLPARVLRSEDAALGQMKRPETQRHLTADGSGEVRLQPSILVL